MLKNIFKKEGYVSIEAIIIVGIMLALGIVILVSMFSRGSELASVSIDRLDTALIDFELIDY